MAVPNLSKPRHRSSRERPISLRFAKWTLKIHEDRAEDRANGGRGREGMFSKITFDRSSSRRLTHVRWRADPGERTVRLGAGADEIFPGEQIFTVKVAFSGRRAAAGTKCVCCQRRDYFPKKPAPAPRPGEHRQRFSCTLGGSLMLYRASRPTGFGPLCPFLGSSDVVPPVGSPRSIR